MSIFPVQLITSRIGNLTRLIYTLAICDENTYIQYSRCFERQEVKKVTEQVRRDLYPWGLSSCKKNRARNLQPMRVLLTVLKKKKEKKELKMVQSKENPVCAVEYEYSITSLLTWQVYTCTEVPVSNIYAQKFGVSMLFRYITKIRIPPAVARDIYLTSCTVSTQHIQLLGSIKKTPPYKRVYVYHGYIYLSHIYSNTSRYKHIIYSIPAIPARY